MSYDYFMENLQPWEVNNILSNLKYADYTTWETSRFIAYLIAKANFKNIGKIKDFLPLEWDKDGEQEDDKPQLTQKITQDDVNRLKELAEKWK